jgi:hypothetical protein
MGSPDKQIICDREEFNEILLGAIDDALSSLGHKSRVAVYLHLEEKFHLKREDIPQRLEEFSDVLEKIFGLGSRYLEILSMRNLHTKLANHSKFQLQNLLNKNLTFKNYVEATRASYVKKTQTLAFEVVVDEVQKQQQRV